jgi:exodeoxyribonuclease VII large subunit
MTIPVIVGVGHETDFTIADFVADLRAPTPSQAAELAVPEQAEYLARLRAIAELLDRVLRRRLRDDQRKLDTLEHRLGRAHPGVALRAKQQRLDEFEGRLKRALNQTVAQVTARTQLIERSLKALSPLATLSRGYAIVCRADTGELLTRSAAVRKGARIDVRLADGALAATVDSTRPGNKQ